jgi:hypothetical protein
MFRSFNARLATLAVVAVSGFTLSGCFWDSDSNPTVAASNLTVTASATSVASVVNTDYVFPAVPAFGTAAATTLKFTSATATPAFSISAAEGTATGTTTFGSCIFTVTASTFPASSPLGVGKVVTVNPCSLTVNTKGVEAGTQSASLGTTVLLGTISSGSVTKVVTLDANGNVAIGGVTVGSVTLVESTGATGGGG